MFLSIYFICLKERNIKLYHNKIHILNNDQQGIYQFVKFTNDQFNNRNIELANKRISILISERQAIRQFKENLTSETLEGKWKIPIVSSEICGSKKCNLKKNFSFR